MLTLLLLLTDDNPLNVHFTDELLSACRCDDYDYMVTM